MITQSTLFKTGIITIQNDEVVFVEVQNYLDLSNLKTTYTYDNQYNPNKNILGIDKLKVEQDRVGGIFKNTILSSSIYNSSQYFTTDFTYIYNANGYPSTSNYIFNGINIKSEYFY